MPSSATGTDAVQGSGTAVKMTLLTLTMMVVGSMVGAGLAHCRPASRRRPGSPGR